MIYSARCWACEILVSLSLWVCPSGYTPSYVEAVVVAHKGNLFKAHR